MPRIFYVFPGLRITFIPQLTRYRPTLGVTSYPKSAVFDCLWIQVEVESYDLSGGEIFGWWGNKTFFPSRRRRETQNPIV